MPLAKSREGQNVLVVHNLIRTAILHGELEPGSNISLGKLANLFEAGRTPLREALRMLQHEGLVIASPNHKVQIARLTAEDFEDISIARLSLETVAIRITVPTLTSADCAQLVGYMAQMDHYQSIGDQVGFREPHRAFHRMLVNVAPCLDATIDELADHAERYRLHFGTFGSWEENRDSHRVILDAVIARNADLAAVCLTEHYVRIILHVFSVLDPNHDLSRLRIAINSVAPNAHIEAL